MLGVSSCKVQDRTPDMVKKDFDFAGKQLAYAQSEIASAVAHEPEASKVMREKNNWEPLVSPRTIEKDGSLQMVPSKDWTSGFFPGELWYMYEYTKDAKWEQLARQFTAPVEREKLNGKTHDMGFKVYCSFGNGYRLTKDEKYRDILLQSAYTLATRYKPKAGIIRSWDHSSYRWKCPVIIDNMMNLELLFWAFAESQDSLFYHIAVTHAETTMKNHFRPDYSSYHVIDYDTITGDVLKKNTHQGYAHESAWARGQAWGLYGYTLCYRETKKPEFLEQAKHIAGFIFTHPNLPSDLIPYWDYNAPGIPNEPRDVSAATVTASALLELSMYDMENAAKYKDWANTILKNLSDNYLAKQGSDRGFLLLHSTGTKPTNTEVDVPLAYADYYFLEALLRKQKLEKTGKVF
ncbi:MAG: glycoside hydrolase family 88 protein [Prevotella sp.]|nr:glycoside hydrolase family 88 protein [Prevotella sp.]